MNVRAFAWKERATLAVSAACLVANSAREILAAAFGAPVEVRLFEPAIPSATAWDAIVRDARLYAVSGLRANAAIVIRDGDALTLARAAFREFGKEHRALSGIEAAVLDSIVASLAAVLPALHGPSMGAPAAARIESIAGHVTYFELELCKPVVARIGVALGPEPAAEIQGAISLEDLSQVPLELRVCSGAIVLSAQELANLESGDVLPMFNAKDLTCDLRLAGTPLGSGECGVVRDHYALRLV